MGLMTYMEYQEGIGEHARKFIVGDLETDGHTHTFYLRDDLPRATTSDAAGIDHIPHAHSVVGDIVNGVPELVTEPARPNGHIHTVFTEVPNEKS